MSCIVDDAQAILVGDGLYLAGSARFAIDMHRQDGRCARRDGRLDAVGVDASRSWIDIDKDGLDAVPPQRMGGGHKAVGRGDDLAADVEGLQRGDKRQRTVGEQADVGHLEVLTKGGLKPLVEFTVICNPLVVPDLTQHRGEVVEIGQQR